MQATLSGKRIQIVKGSLLAPRALEEALAERGAKVVTANNIIGARSPAAGVTRAMASLDPDRFLEALQC